MKYSVVSSFLDENRDKIKDWSDVIKFYHKDLEAALIACYILDIDDEYILSLYSLNSNKTEDDIIYIVNEYQRYPKLLEKMIPRNVFSAFILKTNFIELDDLSKEIINEIKNNNDYLLSIKKSNIFETEIIFSQHK